MALDQTKLELYDLELDLYARDTAELIVVASKDARAAIAPITVLQLWTYIEVVIAIAAGRNHPHIVEMQRARQLTVWTREFEAGADVAPLQEMAQDIIRLEIASLFAILECRCLNASKPTA